MPLLQSTLVKPNPLATSPDDFLKIVNELASTEPTSDAQSLAVCRHAVRIHVSFQKHCFVRGGEILAVLLRVSGPLGCFGLIVSLLDTGDIAFQLGGFCRRGGSFLEAGCPRLLATFVTSTKR